MIIDIETYDPGLKERGPGDRRHEGCILGVGILDPEQNLRKYFDFAHINGEPTEQQHNKEVVKELLLSYDTKIGHNILYDLGWLSNELGVMPNGLWDDTITRETLLDQWKTSYSLDNLVGKKAHGLEEKYGKNYVEHLIEEPADVVGMYCLSDCDATLELYNRQKPQLEAEDLLRVHGIECRLLPLVLQMQNRGVRIDNKYRYEQIERFQKEYDEIMTSVGLPAGAQAGGEFNMSKATDWYDFFINNDIPVQYTEKGNPSFNQQVLGALASEYPVLQKLIHAKHIKTVNNNFMKGSLEEQYNGRVYTNFRSSKRDEGGTVTGRFSSDHINLQQIPSSIQTGGSLIRRCFIADEGKKWFSIDLSQIENRIAIHYAPEELVKEIKEDYWKHPDKSYHKMIQKMLCDFTQDDHWMTDEMYRISKSLTFGIQYGMGAKTFSQNFFIPVHQAQEFMKIYKVAVPFIKPLQDTIMATARKRGFLRTLLGRKQRASDDIVKKDLYYKMINHLIQGSAADMIKFSMVRFLEAGLDKVLDFQLTVHDEFDGNYDPENKAALEALQEMKRIMETALTLDIPVLSEMDIDKEYWQGY